MSVGVDVEQATSTKTELLLIKKNQVLFLEVVSPCYQHCATENEIAQLPQT